MIKIIFTDKQLNELKIIILRESKKQFKKFGIQKHSIESWYTILLEEIGEIARAIKNLKYKNNFNNDYNNFREEIIQSITVLCQMFFSKYSLDFENNKDSHSILNLYLKS